MKDVIDKHFDAVDRLIEANSRASDLHREASNKAYYNAAIDQCVSVVVDNYIAGHSVATPLLDNIIKSLTSLKRNNQ